MGNSSEGQFRGVLCQPVHPEPNIGHSRSLSLFDSPPWFVLKTRFRVRKSDFKIIFASSLRFLTVSRPNLINWYLINFGVCSANQCTQNQIEDIFAVFLCSIVSLFFCRNFFSD